MAENEVIDRVKFDMVIPEIIRNEFKSRCSFQRVEMREVLEQLLRNYLVTPMGELGQLDPNRASPLVGFACHIDRAVRNEFKSRCAIEQEPMWRVTARILQEYLATLDQNID